jgi:hypothetical protein
MTGLAGGASLRWWRPPPRWGGLAGRGSCPASTPLAPGSTPATAIRRGGVTTRRRAPARLAGDSARRARSASGNEQTGRNREERLGARRDRFRGDLAARRCARERGAEGPAEQRAVARRPFGDQRWRIAELADRIGGKAAGWMRLSDPGGEAPKEGVDVGQARGAKLERLEHLPDGSRRDSDRAHTRTD